MDFGPLVTANNRIELQPNQGLDGNRPGGTALLLRCSSAGVRHRRIFAGIAQAQMGGHRVPGHDFLGSCDRQPENDARLRGGRHD